MKRFKDREMGECFHTGISKGSGIHADVDMWMEFKKASKSEAECTQQHGYGNQRQVGELFSFSAMTPTFDVGKQND